MFTTKCISCSTVCINEHVHSMAVANLSFLVASVMISVIVVAEGIQGSQSLVNDVSMFGCGGTCL